jgi:hypothetical protein
VRCPAQEARISCSPSAACPTATSPPPFISVETVEAHLTRVARKLDVTSGTALIGALGQSGW